MGRELYHMRTCMKVMSPVIAKLIRDTHRHALLETPLDETVVHPAIYIQTIDVSHMLAPT